MKLKLSTILFLSTFLLLGAGFFGVFYQIGFLYVGGFVLAFWAAIMACLLAGVGK